MRKRIGTTGEHPEAVIKENGEKRVKPREFPGGAGGLP